MTASNIELLPNSFTDMLCS